MVHHLALRLQATVAGVAALLVDAGQSRRALRVHHTLGATADVRVTVILRAAHTGGCRAALLTDGVFTAGRRTTGVSGLLRHRWLGGRLQTTARGPVRIANVASWAAAARTMTDDVTEGIGAAGTGTWVAALLALAAERVGAVRVGKTLRTAADVRVTLVLRQAGADAHAVVVAAAGVLGTRRREARVLGPRSRRWNKGTGDGQCPVDCVHPCSMQSEQAHTCRHDALNNHVLACWQ